MALNVVGNNMNNAYSGDPEDPFITGYSRRDVVMGENGGKSTRYGFFGYGVQVNDVTRAYNGFVANQLRGAASEYYAKDSRYEQLSVIDNMLGDDTNNISSSLGNMFTALEKISSNPVDVSARTEALSQFKTISSQFQSDSSTLTGLEKNTNTQIAQSVQDINAYTTQLAEINDKIQSTLGQTGGMPDDLLDQRDALLTKLSELTDITVDENTANGTVKVSLGNGIPLVNGNHAYSLECSTAADDPSKTVVSYIDASGNRTLLDDEKITGGKLGGLFKFRNEDLVDARNQLNQLALQMANKFNEVNKQGYDRNGAAGQDIFSYDNPVALANRNNAGDASMTVAYADITQVQATDYDLSFDGNAWQVTRADGSVVAPTVNADGSLAFDGITVTPQGSPQQGDSFSLNPVSGVADSLTVAITDGNEIAASSSSDPTEESNNENIKAMMDIKNEQIVGTATLSEAYASLVSSVGSSESALEGERDMCASAAQDILTQQQSIAGVDLDEEGVKMQVFQKYYQANAKILETANTIFDALLSLNY